jgi:Predicted membrane protein (DUF2142)
MTWRGSGHRDGQRALRPASLRTHAAGLASVTCSPHSASRSVTETWVMMQFMRAAPHQSSVGEQVRRPARVSWWFPLGCFVACAAIAGAWALTVPPFAMGDEASSVVRAQAAGRLHLIPEHEAEGTGGAGPRTVQRVGSFPVAETYRSNWECFTGHQDRLPSCARALGVGPSAVLSTYYGGFPPLYYALVGSASVVVRGPDGFYAMRLASAALVAALLALAFDTAVRGRPRRLLALGVLVAATPTVFALGGDVSSAALEVAAAIALWTALLALVERRADDPRLPDLVARATVAAVVLVLARPFSPVWAAVVAVVVAVVAGRTTTWALLRQRSVQIGCVVVAIAGAAAAAWILLRTPQADVTRWAAHAPRPGRLATAQSVAERTGYFLSGMVGWDGWPGEPTVPPATIATGAVLVVIVAASAGVLALVAAAARRGGRRGLMVLGALVVGVFSAPIVLTAVTANTYFPNYSPRYTLPLAVGVPLVASFRLDQAERFRPHTTRLLAAGVVVAFVVAQLALYWTVAHRFTVGARGPILYFLDPQWAPREAAWVLLGVLVLALGWLACAVGRQAATPAAAAAQTDD